MCIYIYIYIYIIYIYKYTDKASVKTAKYFTKYMCFQTLFALSNTWLNGFQIDTYIYIYIYTYI